MGSIVSFHTVINAVLCLGSIYLILDGAIGISQEDHRLEKWVPGVIAYLFYPVVTELLMNIKAQLCRNNTSRDNHKCPCDLIETSKQVLPIVFHPRYNVSFLGLEKCHPFDAQKYGRVFDGLLQKKTVDLRKQTVHRPGFPGRELLSELMSASYLFKLNYSLLICKYLEAPLFFLPEFLLRWRVLEPMQLATQGSLDAACLALKHGWAINLAGGYHHAHCECGGGFCIYPDITMIVHYARKWHGIKKVMIVDLDAHQGNGHERDLMKDDNVHIVDAYNPYIYPGDDFAKSGIKTYIPVTPHDDDESYLRVLR